MTASFYQIDPEIQLETGTFCDLQAHSFPILLQFYSSPHILVNATLGLIPSYGIIYKPESFAKKKSFLASKICRVPEFL